MNQFFEKPCPARWRAKPTSRAWAGSKKTTASAAMHPFLVPPKREHVDAGAPGHVGRRHVQPRDGVGETRAVHVDGGASPLRDFRQRRDLCRCVGHAEFRDLRDADRDRPAVVDSAFGKFREPFGERLRRKLAARRVKTDDLRPAAEKFRRTRLIDVYVRLAVTEDDAARPGVRRKGKRVGSSPARHDEHRHLVLEDFRQPAFDGLGQVVVPISWAALSSCFGEGGDYAIGGPRPIVACENHGGCSGDVVCPAQGVTKSPPQWRVILLRVGVIRTSLNHCFDDRLGKNMPTPVDRRFRMCHTRLNRTGLLSN